MAFLVTFHGGILLVLSCVTIGRALYRATYGQRGEVRVGGGVNTFQCGLVGSFTSPGIDTR